MRRTIMLLATALLALAMLGAAPAALADPASDSAKLREAVTLKNIRKHQAALQAIANANGGIRAAGTPGYAASVDYVVETLQDAGWDVERDPFPFVFVPPAVLQQLTPVSATYETGAFTGTGTGDVSRTVVPVDINLVGDRASTSGCEAADFSGLSVADLAQTVTLQDAAPLTRIPGIGKKTAERLLLELKGKLAEAGAPAAHQSSDVVNALVALGYSDKEALVAVKGLAPGMPVAEAIRAALKALAKS